MITWLWTDSCGHRDVVLVAVMKNGFALEYASEEMRGDGSIVLQAVTGHWQALHYASAELYGNR